MASSSSAIPSSTTKGAAIVLIGPMATGKSTVSPALSARLGIPLASIDSEIKCLKDYGMNFDEYKRIAATKGDLEAMRYSAPYDIQLLKRMVTTHSCIVDAGAGYSCYEDEKIFAEAQSYLSSCANVVLILPSPDEAKTLAILRARREAAGLAAVDPSHELNTHFVRHPSQRRLATITVYNDGLTTEQTVEAICKQLKGVVVPPVGTTPVMIPCGGRHVPMISREMYPLPVEQSVHAVIPYVMFNELDALRLIARTYYSAAIASPSTPLTSVTIPSVAAVGDDTIQSVDMTKLDSHGFDMMITPVAATGAPITVHVALESTTAIDWRHKFSDLIQRCDAHCKSTSSPSSSNATATATTTSTDARQ